MKDELLVLLNGVGSTAKQGWQLVSCEEARKFYSAALNLVALVLVFLVSVSIITVRAAKAAYVQLSTIEAPEPVVESAVEVTPGELVNAHDLVGDMVTYAMTTKSGREWHRDLMIGSAAVCDRRQLVEAWLVRGLADFRESLKKKEVLASNDVTPRPILRSQRMLAGS